MKIVHRDGDTTRMKTFEFRKLGKSKYQLVRRFIKKSSASNYAAQYRREGYKARVIKLKPRGYKYGVFKNQNNMYVM